jgi:hypothetical protein
MSSAALFEVHLGTQQLLELTAVLPVLAAASTNMCLA